MQDQACVCVQLENIRKQQIVSVAHMENIKTVLVSDHARPARSVQLVSIYRSAEENLEVGSAIGNVLFLQTCI
jgi:hypothetical protein